MGSNPTLPTKFLQGKNTDEDEGNLHRLRDNFTTNQPEKIPTIAPAKMSEGQWIPEKTLAREIKKAEIKNTIPAFLL